MRASTFWLSCAHVTFNEGQCHWNCFQNVGFRSAYHHTTCNTNWFIRLWMQQNRKSFVLQKHICKAISLAYQLCHCLFVGCLTSQQHASVSQGRICSDNFTCCHTEIEVADQTFYLIQSHYTDTGPTSPSADPITAGAWQGSYWSANF